MTDVIIHIYPGIARESIGTFDEMKELGLDQFKNYLLSVLGHVGISFLPDETVYGYGPNITQEDLDNLRPLYENIRKSDSSRKKTKWTALNFLFYPKSPIFVGKISDDTEFFNEHQHIKIPLKLVDKTAQQALYALNGIEASYGSPYLDDTKENCLTAIFNHLTLTYPDGNPVVLSEVYMLRQTLKELQTKYKGKKKESGASKQGGKRRRKRKTKRKKKRTKRRKRKRRCKTKRRR